MAWGMHGGLQGGWVDPNVGIDARDVYSGPEYQRMDANEQRAHDAREWSLGMYDLMNTPFGEWMGKKGFIPKDFDEFNKLGWTDAIFDTGFVTDIPPKTGTHKNKISFNLDDTDPIQGGLFSGSVPHRTEGREN